MNRHRPLFWLALFLALHGAFLRAFIPAGFMPSFSDGEIRLAFCTPSGAQTTLADDDTVHAGDECVYGLALSAALTSDAVSFAVSNTLAAKPVSHADGIRVTAVRAYSARGPPVLVG